MLAQLQSHYASLGQDFGQHLDPTPLQEGRLLHGNEALARTLGLDNATLADLACGTATGTRQPFAMVYAGHQFGGYSPRLGDGRGLLLGECQTGQGLLDLHLKGAGLTPYSRFGDGRAVLRSCIREYLASLALRGLGMASTQALAIATSREPVAREKTEPRATLIRVSPCHVRFGHFEYFFYRNDTDNLAELIHYCARRYLQLDDDSTHQARALLQLATDSSAHMIAHWQAMGFAHGVMNTDNMSLIGETFDFGPYGFLDDFEPGFICNHSDHHGRYAFDRQPAIGLWNLNALAHALSPFIAVDDIRASLGGYEARLQNRYFELMAGRLGLTAGPAIQPVLTGLLGLLQSTGADYHGCLRALAEAPDQLPAALAKAPGASQWLQDFTALSRDYAVPDQQAAMCAANPVYSLRNHLAQRVISAAEQSDDAPLGEFAALLARPFTPQADREAWAQAPAAAEKHLPISCSS